MDAIAARLTSHGVRLEQEPTDTEWGTREPLFLDDQGHTIYAGHESTGAAV